MKLQQSESIYSKVTVCLEWNFFFLFAWIEVPRWCVVEGYILVVVVGKCVDALRENFECTYKLDANCQ